MKKPKPCANRECDNPIPPGHYKNKIYCSDKCKNRENWLRRLDRRKPKPKHQPKPLPTQGKINKARKFASLNCVKYRQCIANPKKQKNNAMCYECEEAVIKRGIWKSEPGILFYNDDSDHLNNLLIYNSIEIKDGAV